MRAPTGLRTAARKSWNWLRTGHYGLPGEGRSFGFVLRRPRWWGAPRRVWRVLAHRRRARPVPMLYVVVGGAGAVFGAVLRGLLRVRWWIAPVALLGATWLGFLSTIRGGATGGVGLRTELLSAIAPGRGAERRRSERRAHMLTFSSPLFGIADRSDGPKLSSTGENERGIDQISVIYGECDASLPNAEAVEAVAPVAPVATSEPTGAPRRADRVAVHVFVDGSAQSPTHAVAAGLDLRRVEEARARDQLRSELVSMCEMQVLEGDTAAAAQGGDRDTGGSDPGGRDERFARFERFMDETRDLEWRPAPLEIDGDSFDGIRAEALGWAAAYARLDGVLVAILHDAAEPTPRLVTLPDEVRTRVLARAVT